MVGNGRMVIYQAPQTLSIVGEVQIEPIMLYYCYPYEHRLSCPHEESATSGLLGEEVAGWRGLLGLLQQIGQNIV